ncbi:MAG: sodium:proton antiporter NhaD [Prevotella sp.]|nr:sodium:proton antiporter NhaD [Prevotella sp.]MBQ8153031.1 sodium:proton antiporter NhaD [Prevotella sp.]MBQ8715700.1 sodium:proton antiporter NhaD [Prevotella sp.]
MTLIIVLLLIVSYLLIATGHLTGVNKAAIAMFLGTAGWVVYVCYGTDFVMQQHPSDYMEYLAGAQPTSDLVKYFIYDHIFLKYVGKAAAIVMFLLATMSIIELLNNNGCFDFITEWIRTRNSKRLLWTITIATYIISANLDNLTTTTMMLVIMHNIVQSGRQRMLVGSAIVLAANCGGCFTVIGDPTGLILWGDGAVTATHFSAYLAIPSLLAWVIPTILINFQLPDRLDCEWSTSPYRGDDTRLNRWQRLVMLLVGIGGLWFIPTFHNITKLAPFLGALCVLSVLWVVNEAFNHKLMNADQMAQRRIPRALQYGAIQQMLFVMGIMMGMGVVAETGVFGDIATWFDENIHNIWLIGLGSGILSSLIDTFTVAVSDIMLYPIAEAGDMAANGAYWEVIAFCTAAGGCLLCVGSTSGVALMKMEHVRLGWYLKNLTPKVAIGWLVGLVVLWMEINLI